MNKDAKIFVAGHRGMVGSAIVRNLQSKGYHNIITRSHAELDLTCQQEVRELFRNEKIDQVYLAAAKVGGIHANNTYPAEFIYQNLLIEALVIHEAYASGVQKLLYLGSSCIYPRLAEQPMCEDILLAGKLEPTNEPYAIAKIAGIKMCESYNRQYGTDYRSVMPTNLYGLGDNFHDENSHVIPALIRRFHEAKVAGRSKVKIWGTGAAYREFLHVDDMALACSYIMNLPLNTYLENTSPTLSHINVGSGTDISIMQLAYMIAATVGYEGAVEFDSSKPDGAPRKLLNVEKLSKLGWRPTIGLKEGLRTTYDWYRKNGSLVRGQEC